MLATRVVPINLCKCGLVGSQGEEVAKKVGYGDGKKTHQGGRDI